MRRGVTAQPAAGSVGLTLVGKFQSLLNREQNNERSVATMFYSSNTAGLMHHILRLKNVCLMSS